MVPTYPSRLLKWWVLAAQPGSTAPPSRLTPSSVCGPVISTTGAAGAASTAGDCQCGCCCGVTVGWPVMVSTPGSWFGVVTAGCAFWSFGFTGWVPC